MIFLGMILSDCRWSAVMPVLDCTSIKGAEGRTMVKLVNRRRVVAGLAGGLAVGLAAPAWAQAPAPPAQTPATGKTIRLIVGASPGGTTDMLAREIADSFQQTLKQTVIVENRPGAGANLAAEMVARSAPDGTTFLVAYTSHTMNASLFKSLPYEPIDDFTPISLIAKTSTVLVVNPKLPIENLAAFVAAATAKPDRFNFAIGGLGSTLHMDTALLRTTLKLTGADVPYKGSSPALTDVVAGHVEAMFAPIGVALPMIQAGRVRAIAVTAPQRLAVLPDVPTIREAVPELPQSFAWFGLLAPAKLPADITARMSEAMRAAQAGSRLRDKMDQDGGTLVPQTPDEFRAFLAADRAHWAGIIKAAGIVPE
jgi:tripartite-type tricarboxylate transporter receptor subunit TctC